MYKLLLLLLIVSCSSFNSKKNHNFADQRVDHFLKSWTKDHSEISDNSYKRNYYRYIKDVEQVFLQQGMSKKIDFYLTSLKDLHSQTGMAQANYDKINEAVSDTTRTKALTESYDEAIQKRSDDLLEYYGFNFYSRLMENRNAFIKKESDGKNFPL